MPSGHFAASHDARRCWALVVLFAITAVVGCGRSSPDQATGAGGSDHQTGSVTVGAEAETAGPVIVLAAASTARAVQELAVTFGAETGITVRVSTGPSSTLANQIVAGAPADVFLSASSSWADVVQRAELAAARVPLLANEIVLVVPPGGKQSRQSQGPPGFARPASGSPAGDRMIGGLLTGDAYPRIAVAAASVPLGAYTRHAFRHLGIRRDFADPAGLITASDSRVTSTFVARGEVDAGIVYASDASGSDSLVQIATFSEESSGPIVYPLVRIRRADQTAGVETFFDFLQTDLAAEVFRRHGFSVLP